MGATPDNSRFDYAVSANFNLELPCRNQRNLYSDYLEESSEFLDEALYKLKGLVEDSIKARERGESIPLILEIYDADIFSESSS